MKLFDEIERDSHEPAQYAELIFAFLNRSARDESGKVRSELEKWFARYPVSDQVELLSRFRSDIGPQHQGAFFELFLHELLLRLGCSVTLHPPLPDVSRTPDFLVEPQNGSRFYMEATLATDESREETAARARMDAVYDVLNRKVNSPNFFIHLRIVGAPATPPNATKLATFIQDRLSELNPDDIAKIYESHGINSMPQWHFEHDGWKLEILPIPKKPEARGKLGVRPIGSQLTGFHWLDQRTSIRDAILKKAGKYGNVDLPYIVAVNASGFIEEEDIVEALFGKEQFTYLFSPDETTPVETQRTRIPDGAWIGPDGPKYTRISGVLLATRLTAWNVPRTNLRLYHNPWAQKPYRSVLTQLPCASLKDEYLEYLPGLSIDEIFPLPPSWPENGN